MLENREILNIIPHRYPIILVDRIIEMEEGKRAVGIKNVSANEPFFQGHFPGQPIMPGVLIMEALAQVGAVLILSKEEYKGCLAFYAGLDEVRFKRQVIPGDLLRLEIELVKMKRGIGVAWGEAYVGEELAAKGRIMFAIGPKNS
jgi:3-hydroxyacyl-[acyl-carrier-protein] dehydratase